ncbi:MAG TPA: porin [Fimbriiglobus sp.]|nr:porin [Fimbriiglobus sp.]
MSTFSWAGRCAAGITAGVLAAGIAVAQQPAVLPPITVPAVLPSTTEQAPATPPTTAPPTAPPATPPGQSLFPAPAATPSPVAAPAAESVTYPTAKISGFFHLDAIYSHQSPLNLRTVGPAQDGLDFRRARIAGVGNLAENITYMLEFDFAASQARFVDDWVTFSKVPFFGNIRVGRYRQPFGMAELTSIRELTFLERSSSFALAPFRQTGVMWFDTAQDDRVTYALSGFRYNSDPFGNVYTNIDGYGLAGRATALPIYEENGSLLHVGADYGYNRAGGTNPIRYSSTPEVFAGDVTGSVLLPNAHNLPPYVDTGSIVMSDSNLFNLEAAYAYRNFLVQSEARCAVVRQAAGGTVTLPAFYAHARYVLTGEKIPYSKKNGVFTRVKPDCPVDKGGYGAWEVAFRWSYIDLNGTNGTINGEPAPGRSMNVLTLGLNWYLVNNAKFQFNYIHPILDDPTLGTSNADYFAVRCQIDF